MLLNKQFNYMYASNKSISNNENIRDIFEVKVIIRALISARTRGGSYSLDKTC
jgi:hypothetical protein